MRKTKLLHSLLLVLYLISLVPFGSIVVSDEVVDLRQTINSLQALQSATIATGSDIQIRLRGSINSVRTLAGLNSFLATKEHDDTDVGQNVIITFKLRIPYLLPIEPKPQYIKSTWLQACREPDNNFTSIFSPPDSPPPNIA